MGCSVGVFRRGSVKVIKRAMRRVEDMMTVGV